MIATQREFETALDELREELREGLTAGLKEGFMVLVQEQLKTQDRILRVVEALADHVQRLEAGCVDAEKSTTP